MRGALFSLALLAIAPLGAPAQTPDPLRCLPPVADLVIKVEQPRELLESVFKLSLFPKAMNLKVAQQALDTADFRKFRDLVAFFEKDLGKPWPELVDGIAGGGIALGVKYAGGQSPALLAIQARDEGLLKKFVAGAIGIVEQEQNRNESKSKVECKVEEGYEAYKIDDNLFAIRAGSTLLIAGQKEVAKAAIEHLGKLKADSNTPSMATHAGPQAAKASLAGHPQAWLWFNLEYVKSLEGAKGIFEQPRNDSIQTFLFAGILDIARRANMVAAGLTASPAGYDIAIKMPAGLENRGADTVLHLPKDKAENWAMPLLKPANSLFAHSFYLDFAAFYTEREKIFNKEVSKQLMEGQKQLSKVLPNASLEKLLGSTGPIHQAVFAHSDKLQYKKEPGQRIPPGAFVMSMRDIEGGKKFEALVRAGGFLATASGVPLKMTEEQHGGAKLLVYRFDETKPFPGGDPNNLRFNFAPTFVDLGSRLIFSATPDLAKELIDLAKNPGNGPQGHGYENMAMQFSADGLASLVAADPQAVVTQLILSQSMREGEAKKEANLLIGYIRDLGILKINTVYDPKTFQMNIRWTIKPE